jgi:hypothetical protein
MDANYEAALRAVLVHEGGKASTILMIRAGGLPTA